MTAAKRSSNYLLIFIVEGIIGGFTALLLAFVIYYICRLFQVTINPSSATVGFFVGFCAGFALFLPTLGLLKMDNWSKKWAIAKMVRMKSEKWPKKVGKWPFLTNKSGQKMG